MIDPRELRLENLLRVTKDGLTLQVIVKGIYNNTVNTAFFNISIDDLNGIPLTEEWLVKFGFDKKDDHIQRGKIMALPVEFRWFSNGPYLELGCNNGIYMGSRIKYVHEYQNLYFALTGQELAIK